MADSKHEGQPAPSCPVDHKSREAWLSQARTADAESPSLPPSHPPVTTTTTTTAEACPVDHKARDVWMQQARAAAAASATSPAPPPPPPQHPSSSSSSSPSWTSYLPRIPFYSRPSGSSSPPSSSSPLGVEREVSTIPRAPPEPQPSPSPPSSPFSAAANHEQETGADSATGNWVYPSERMFFEAMRRKGHDPRTADMRTVVPIHNAVNERAWAEIKAWEEPWVRGTSCDGPRLHSFTGLSTRLSPRARVNTLLGYQAPFDRHDWVVDRCGKEVEYVIDFYTGRNTASAPLSFYLDVRPKLNSWEGVKMRAMRAAGLT